MNKCVCDICKKNDADHVIKAKKRWVYSDGFKGTWTKIDICEECFWKLFRAKKGEEHETD